MDTTKILIQCSDEIGLIAKISGVLFEQKLNVMVNDEFVDKKNNKFFMRSELATGCEHRLILENLEMVLPGDANIRIIKPLSHQQHFLITMCIFQFDNVNCIRNRE